MKQTGSVILEYHKAESQGASSYWTGKVLGRDMKFVRIIVGLAHPTSVNCTEVSRPRTFTALPPR
jgi:hypothetical protein